MRREFRRTPDRHKDEYRTLLNAALQEGLISDIRDEVIGRGLNGEVVYALRFKDGEMVDINTLRERLGAIHKPGVVWRPVMTPEAAAEEAWAAYHYLKAMQGSDRVTYGDRSLHTPSEIADFIAQSDIYVFTSKPLREHTKAFDKNALKTKWWGHRPNLEDLPMTPMFVLLDVNIPLIDYDFNPDGIRKTKTSSALVSSFLIREEKTPVGTGLRITIFAVDPKTNVFQVSTQPLVLVNNGDDRTSKLGVRAMSHALAFELLDFSRQKIVEHRTSYPSDDNVHETSQLFKRPNLFIPQIKTIIMREKEVITTQPVTHDFNGREITFQQDVQRHTRTYHRGTDKEFTIVIEPFKRYPDLPKRPAPGATVHMVTR